MSPRRRVRSHATLAGLVGFAGGVVLTLMLLYSPADWPRTGPHPEGDDCGHAVLDNAKTDAPVRTAAPAEGATPPGGVPRIGVDPVAELRDRRLLIPVEGYDRTALRSSFDQPRGAGRRHEAMDLLAPRHTPVLAVEDGTIARLFSSRAGGITVYQFDPSTSYVYYYAHLERYAAGLRDGDDVRRGQVIGYVGTTGNAPPDTPHLHFAIYRLTDRKQWWDGAAIDPFDVLR